MIGSVDAVAAPAADRAPRWTRADRDATALWVLSRVAVLVLASAGAWLLADPVTDPLLRWRQWDAVHLLGIAEHGYGGRPTGVPNEAFFPGLPVLMWLVSAVGPSHLVSGLLISAVAGAVAAVALSRLAELESAGAGRWAVLLWVAAPPAVFLAAPYTEALFCALAFAAWLSARRDRWVSAAVLAAAASTVRISGLFLAAALAVQWLTATPRRWRQAPLLLLPLVPVVAYFGYLRVHLGSWSAWFDAQRDEWNRDPTWPWDSVEATWDAAFGPAFAAQWGAHSAWMFRAELVTVAVALLLTVALLVRRRWGEATWVGLQLITFVTSSWVFSLPRATLLWWPLWVGVAVVAVRRPWLGAAWLAVSAPLMAVWTAAYLQGIWAG